MDSQRGVHYGTCGWSDESIKTCGRFYPSWVRTSEQRLEIYSKSFACVEVDSSTYAIPSPSNTKKWATSTPTGFKFHFKAFGLFTHQSSPLNTLPQGVRQQLAGDLPPQSTVTLQQLGLDGERRVWDAFHAALEPVIKAGKMGCVVFQFQLSFLHSQKNLEYVEHCRRMLDPGLQMAVEFRNRSWFTEAAAAQTLSTWLSARGMGLVSADELHHETYQKDRQQRGLPHGEKRRIMPIAMQVTQPAFHYIRLHRRHGTVERLVPEQEIQAWAHRIAESLAPSVQGPIYFLWGTDHEDAPVVNMRALDAALKPELRFDWRAHVQSHSTQARGSIAAMLQRGKAAAAVGAAPPPAAEDAPQAGSSDAGGVTPLEEGAQSGLQQRAAAAAQWESDTAAAATTAGEEKPPAAARAAGEEKPPAAATTAREEKPPAAATTAREDKPLAAATAATGGDEPSTSTSQQAVPLEAGASMTFHHAAVAVGGAPAAVARGGGGIPVPAAAATKRSHVSSAPKVADKRQKTIKAFFLKKT